jgi:predicted phosphodiesterase
MATIYRFYGWTNENDKMRYLICGDIHGNLPALELMLLKEKNSYDILICHGDVVNYGPWSNECVDLLDTINDAVLLKGNHEEYFLNGFYHGVNEVANAFFKFCYPKFSNFELINNYDQSYEINDFKIQHTILGKYIFKDTNIDYLDHNYIIGHSHQQFDKFIGDKRLINTGSIGQNRAYINCINYLICDEIKSSILLKTEVYDHSVIINQMETNLYPQVCINYYKKKDCYYEI